MISVVSNHENGQNFRVGSKFQSDYMTLKQVKEVNPNRYNLAKKYLTQIKKENFVSGSKTNLNNVKPFTVKAKKIKSQIQDYDKYALTESETVRYTELKALKEKEGKLKLKKRREFEALADRKEFNELRNNILREGGDPEDYFAHSVRYEKLYKKFKEWVPKGNIEVKPIKINKKDVKTNKDAFKLTSDEKKVYKELKQNNAGLNDNEKIYKRALDDKVTLNRYHNSLTEGKLEPRHNDEYIKLYNKHKKE